MTEKSYIYLVQQSYRRGYNTYDSFVIICDSEEEARNTHPCPWHGIWDDESWCPKHLVDREVDVTRLGITHKQEKEIVCKSFNAG